MSIFGNKSSTENSVCSVNCSKLDELWHFRLGHLSRKNLLLVNKTFSDIDMPTDHVCDICLQSKQKRLPFSVSMSYTNRMFELVYIDIWGPTVMSLQGFRYFLTVVDDFTRFT